MTSQGAESPIVLVPGIQGRWEWMAPAIDALARRHPVLTFSLGEATPPDLFRQWTERIDRLLDAAGATEATIVGVSFGGLIAAWYSSRRPRRVARLVLVSTPSPRWTPDSQTARYVRYPRLSLPLFMARATGRLLPEVLASLPGLTSKARFGAAYALRALRFPVSPTAMAGIVHEWTRQDLEAATRAVTAPTLVVTGETHLDRVVPVGSSLEILSMIAGARHVTLARTGHIGLISRPREFAAIVTDFIETGDPLAGPGTARHEEAPSRHS